MFEEMLRELLAAYGPSGREESVREVIKIYAAPCCDEVYTDALGNLIAHKRGRGERIMLSAHMDQIGLIVTDIDERGYLYVGKVGGVSPTMAISRVVRFRNGVKGVTYYENRDNTYQSAELKHLFIDIGAADKAEAERMVSIGDMAVFHTEMNQLGGRITSGNLDNRASCAVLLETLRTMETEHEVFAVFTAQEEVGLRGAGAAAYAIQPDLSINLDVTVAGDTPLCRRASLALGKGPAIKVMDGSVIVSPAVRDCFVDAAEAAGIPYQLEVVSAGSTDAGPIQRTGSGILAGGLSIPCRYMHTPAEVVDAGDLEHAVRLLCAILGDGAAKGDVL